MCYKKYRGSRAHEKMKMEMEKKEESVFVDKQTSKIIKGDEMQTFPKPSTIRDGYAEKGIGSMFSLLPNSVL